MGVAWGHQVRRRRSEEGTHQNQRKENGEEGEEVGGFPHDGEVASWRRACEREVVVRNEDDGEGSIARPLRGIDDSAGSQSGLAHGHSARSQPSWLSAALATQPCNSMGLIIHDVWGALGLQR